MTYQTVELGTGFWAIEQQGVRCFLLEGREYALLVDTGYGGELREVCAGLTDKPIRLVHTHSDRDHVGASAQFAPRYMHPAEFSTHQLKNGSPAGCLPIWEGEIIDLGTYRLEVVLIPGHTPGSIALLERDKRFIIGGDSIQDNPIYMFGPGRDLAAFAASMEKLLAMQEAFDTVYPSHGGRTAPVSVIGELLTLAREICAGVWPAPRPAPAHLPAGVQIYGKGQVSLLLQKEEQ